MTAGAISDHAKPSDLLWYFTFKSRAMRFARTWRYSGNSDRLFASVDVVIIGGRGNGIGRDGSHCGGTDRVAQPLGDRAPEPPRFGHRVHDRPGHRTFHLEEHERERVLRLARHPHAEVLAEPAREVEQQVQQRAVIAVDPEAPPMVGGVPLGVGVDLLAELFARAAVWVVDD